MRIPVTRHDLDGTIIDGTAEYDGHGLTDFRDLDGLPLVLPPGSSFVVDLDTGLTDLL